MLRQFYVRNNDVDDDDDDDNNNSSSSYMLEAFQDLLSPPVPLLA